MRSRPGMFSRRSPRSRLLTPAVTSLAAMAVLGGLAIQPAAVDRSPTLRPEPAAESYDWLYDTSAEQLRQDQCLMNDVLRLGGPAMAQSAQDGLNQPQDQLHVLADRKRWDQTPLAVAYKKDRDAASSAVSAFGAQRDAWAKPLAGLSNPLEA